MFFFHILSSLGMIGALDGWERSHICYMFILINNLIICNLREKLAIFHTACRAFKVIIPNAISCIFPPRFLAIICMSQFYFRNGHDVM